MSPASSTRKREAASVWELAIKRSLGKLETDIALTELVHIQCKALCIELLPIRSEHALALESLPFHHRDPFDRLLVARAIIEGPGVVSADKSFDGYPVERVW